MSTVMRILRSKRQESSISQNLQRITALERLQSCNIDIVNLDYRTVRISPDSVIYCDIPYANIKKYANGTDFYYEKFFQWCKIQTVPVYVSSFLISCPGFEVVAEIPKRELMSTVRTNKRMERLYRVRQ